MICTACQERRHGDCRELARQLSLAGSVTALASSLCDCQHQASPAPGCTAPAATA